LRKRSFIFALSLVAFSISIAHVSAQVILITVSLSVSVDPATITVGEQVTVSGRLRSTLLIANPGIPDKTISIEARREGESTWDPVGQDVTDQGGYYTFTWTTSRDGNYEVRAAYGDTRSSVVMVTVNPAPLPIELIVGVAVAVVAAVVVVFLYLRKRPKKPKPSTLSIRAEPETIFADGKSTSNLTIELLDSDGKPIETEDDRGVSLYATEGNVAKQVTIPKGKSSVTAPLASSTKIGTVVVTAESGRLTGDRTEVTFKEKKRYCMHCGERMPVEATSCPRCGNAPPSGVDTKVCSNCSEVIPIVAKYCSECGASQPT
jgi:ribosomal protein L40E/5-hydroxyisourate hydrolase-like protein (transthyretin family)